MVASRVPIFLGQSKHSSQSKNLSESFNLARTPNRWAGQEITDGMRRPFSSNSFLPLKVVDVASHGAECSAGRAVEANPFSARSITSKKSWLKVIEGTRSI
jgi:hypothetical protein